MTTFSTRWRGNSTATRTAAILVAGALVQACAGEAAPPPDAPVADPRVEEVLTTLRPAVQFEGEEPDVFSLTERMEYYKVPGASIALVEGDSLSWLATYGLSDMEPRTAVKTWTLFQAASISKPVAALAALSLVEEGLLALDAPVNDYLTSWKVPDNEFTADSAVTLRGLLTHSAGLTVWGFPGYRKDEPFADGQPVPTNVQVLDGEGNTDPVRVYKVPGTGWQYSGGGFTVMEQMIEDVTGMPFHEVAHARVLEPAGMVRSTYEQPIPDPRWPEVARGYRGDGSEVEGEWHTYPEQAAAGLWTTPADLMILSMHLKGILDGRITDGILSRDILEEMLSPNHPGDEAFEGWGLGIGLRGEGADEAFTHGGSNEGFKAQWFTYRERGQGIAVMTNGDQGSALAQEILRAASEVYDWPDFKSETRARATPDQEALEEFAGDYELEVQAGFVITIRAGEGSLEVEVPGQGTFSLYASAENDDQFFDRNDGDVLQFERDDSGGVVAGVNTAGNRFRRVDLP